MLSVRDNATKEKVAAAIIDLNLRSTAGCKKVSDQIAESVLRNHSQSCFL